MVTFTIIVAPRAAQRRGGGVSLLMMSETLGLLRGGTGFVASLPTALIGDRVAPPLQGVAIDWLRTMTNSGHILGPLVLGALADAVHLSPRFFSRGPS
jgi:hypothetical protein